VSQQVLIHKPPAVDPSLKFLSPSDVACYVQRVNGTFGTGGQQEGIFEHKKFKRIPTFPIGKYENYVEKVQKVRLSNGEIVCPGSKPSISAADSLVLSGLRQTRRSHKVSHGSKILMNLHFDKAALFIDKYFFCVDPTPQLQYVMESMGIFDYDTYFDQGKEFHHLVCESEDHFSEIFRPNVKGDRWNPYMRYQSARSSGSIQCSKLMLLSGVFGDVMKSDHEPVFMDYTLTYPSEVDLLLLDPSCREDIIKRMHRCFSKFFNEYCTHFLLDVDQMDLLGASQSLHLWSTAVPLLPHAHHHAIIPHFGYFNIKKEYRLQLDELHEDLYSDVDSCIVSLQPESNNFKHREYSPRVDGVYYSKPDKQFKPERVLKDKLRYDDLCLELSGKVSESLGFELLNWVSSKAPVDVLFIKRLWSACVSEEFHDIITLSDNFLLDVHVNFIPVSQRQRLLHKLQYKTRPPVLDLDMFFRKADGVIVGYDQLDPDALVRYLRSCFVSAVLSENIPAARRFESLLNKAEKIVEQFSAEDLFEWCKFLCFWNTNTRVYGFWRRLQWYMLDRLIDPVLVYSRICPICGGSITPVRHVSRICIDSLVIRTSHGFTVFDLVGGDG